MARRPLTISQVIAVAKGVKSDAEGVLTRGYHDAQSAPRLSGLARSYEPKDDDGDRFPPEGTKLQLRADEIIAAVSVALTRLFDVELTKDGGNQLATADIVVGEKVIAEKVPVTFLLTLEKKLVDLHTFVSKLPVLDASEHWTWSDEVMAWTATSQTTKTKKIPRAFTKAQATDKHPAQVEMFTEDVVVGTWTSIKHSGALPQARVNLLKARVQELQAAVKIARETANATVAPDREIGTKIFDYLLAG